VNRFVEHSQVVTTNNANSIADFRNVFTRRSVITNLSNRDSSASAVRWLTLHNRALTSTVKSQSHIATDGQSVSLSWCRPPAGAHNQMFLLVWKLLSCPCGAPYLTRGRVSHLSVIVSSINSCHYVQIFTSLHLLSNLICNISKTSISTKL
jgi:hypothetical protein